MPELPEVERARKLIADSCTGYTIKSVDTTEDKIVYAGGITHEDYFKELTGRTITGCERKGKIFWMTLSGEGRLPVMHFGMNGMVQIKGQEPTWYVRRPRERPKEWPPKYYKFAMELSPPAESNSDEIVHLAFLDSRRLARLRLVPSPVSDHPPVSALGFDPVLNMPNLEDFLSLLKKKKGTIKGVIMDQAFSAGVGNWVADEILYQARIHPACPVPALSADDLQRLHHWIREIPLTAVKVNAMHGKFPDGWLFRWRWGKGKKQEKRVKRAKEDGRIVEKESGGESEEEEEEEADVKDEKVTPKSKDFMALPDGSPATIVFIEVGGRTTAVVSELQKMPEGVEIKPKITKGGKGSRSKKGKGEDGDEGSSGGSLSPAPTDPDANVDNTPRKLTTPRQKAVAIAKGEINEFGVLNEQIEAGPSKKRTPREKKQNEVKVEVKEETEEVVTPKKRTRAKKEVKDEIESPAKKSTFSPLPTISQHRSMSTQTRPRVPSLSTIRYSTFHTISSTPPRPPLSFVYRPGPALAPGQKRVSRLMIKTNGASRGFRLGLMGITSFMMCI